MWTRLAGVLREIARGGIAGGLAGLVIAGVGGRVVMALAAVLNPDATGLLTENGEQVGRFTVEGTLALLLFGGFLTGLAAGIVWVVVAPWLPGKGGRRLAAAGALAVLVGGHFLVQADNSDFAILQGDALLIGLLLGLVGLVGVGIAWLDGVLEHRLPRPGARSRWHLIAYGLVALAGLPLVPLTVGFFVSGSTCGCANPPVAAGWALVVVGLLTLVRWAAALRSDRGTPPPWVPVAAALGLLAAAVLGGLHLAGEVATIIGRS